MTTPTPSQFDHERLMARLDGLQAHLGALERELDGHRRLAMLGTLTGMIAHEFRNLMVPVRSHTQLALREPRDQALMLKALERAMAASDQAVKVAESILDLAGGRPAAEAGVAEHHSRADIEDVLDQGLLCLARPPEKDGVAVVREIEPGVVAGIPAVDLQQVLMNLILNAVRAMPGGGTLTVRAWHAGSEPHPECSTRNIAGVRTGASGVVVEVEDTGVGMDADQAGRAFEAFGAGAKGVGLGLAICRRLVQRAGGSIEVESVAGRGSCFRIVLPGVEARAAA
jgi:signal transduction histidine kinase